MSSTTRDKYVAELEQLFKTQAAQLYSGQHSLCLTTSCLHFLQQKTAATQDESRKTKDLKKLNDKFGKLKSLKLIPDKKRTVAPSLITLNLTPFIALQTLVLKRVPVVSLTGLHKLREQLTELVIERSLVSSLELVLVQCGGDESSARVWSSLQELDLSVNAIDTLDVSLRYLPVLEKLNLSNNQIGGNQPPALSASITSTITSSSSSSSSNSSPTLTTVATGNHPDYLTGVQYLDKIRWLHLGFNMITSIPPFSEKAQYTLTNVILRNNRLTKIDGIEILDTLKELDLSENLLSRHLDLKPLRNLHHLAVLQLVGNPLVFDPKHRVKSVGFLSNLINPELFVLDGKKLTSTEKKALSRTMTHFLSTSSSSIQSLSSSPVPPTIPIAAHPKTTSLPSSIPSAAHVLPRVANHGSSSSKSTASGGNHRRARERVVHLDDESTVECEDVVSSSSLNKSDSQNVPLLHEKKIQADQDLKKQLKDRWLVTGGSKRVSTSLDEGAPLLPPAASSSPSRRHKRKGKKSSQKSKSSTAIIDDGSPVIQRSSTQPGAEPSTEALSHTSTQPHNGEMGTSTGSSGNGDCQEKVSEKQTLGREWVNIETPYVDPVLSRMDNDAAAVGDQYIVEVFESDTEQEDEEGEGGTAQPDSVILLLTDRFLQEIDINGRVNDQLDLHCLKLAMVEDRVVRGASCRVLVLHFSHERRDRRKREYVLCSDEDESAILDRLTPIATENSSAVSIATKLECLKCQRAIDWSEALDPPSMAPQALFPSPLEKSKSLLNKLCPYCHKAYLIQVSTEAAASPASSSSMLVPPFINNSSPRTGRKPVAAVSVTPDPVRKEDVRDSNSPSVQLPHVDLSYSYPTSPEPNIEKTPPPATHSSRTTSPAVAEPVHLDLSPFVDKPQSNWPGTQQQRVREEDQVDGDTPELRGSAQAAGINNNRNGNSGIERSRPLNPFDEEYDDDDDSPVPYYTADDRHHLPASEPRHSTRYSTRTSPVPISSSHSQQPYPVPSSLPPRDTSTSTERGIFGAGPNSHSQQQQQHYRSSARRELLYNKEPDPFTTPDTTDSSSVPSDSLWNSLASMGRRVTNKKKQKEAQPVPPSSSSHSRSRSVDLNKIAPPPPGLDKRESSATKLYRGSQVSIDSFSSDPGGRGVHDETTSSGAEKHGSSGSGGEKKSSSSSSSRFGRFIGRRSNKTKNSSGDVDKRPASPVIPYKEDDPSYIHNTFNVYLDIEVFDTDRQEQFQLAMKCPMVEYGEWTETESFLIISNLNAFVYRVTAPESLQPTKWLDLKAMLPLRSLVFITIGIGYQWLRLEFGAQASSVQCFTFLIRNEDKCRTFFQKLSYVVSDVPRSLLKNIGVTQFSLMDIKDPEKALRLAVMSHYDHVEAYPDPSSPTSPGAEERDEQLKMYLLAYQYHQGQEPAQVPVTLVLTNLRLFLAIQNHQWPLPKLHPQPSRSDLLPPFSGVIRKEINDIEQIILYDDQNSNFTLQFFSESLHQHEKESWTIILKNSKSVMALVTKLKDLWEEQFKTEFNFTYK